MDTKKTVQERLNKLEDSFTMRLAREIITKPEYAEGLRRQYMKQLRTNLELEHRYSEDEDSE